MEETDCVSAIFVGLFKKEIINSHEDGNAGFRDKTRGYKDGSTG